MTTLEDLNAIITAEPVKGTKTDVVLSLDVETEIDQALHRLSRYFAEDDCRTAVRLQIRGKPLGYLNRRDFYSAPSGTLSRSGFGKAQAAQLPGQPEYGFIQLVCPVAGCETLELRIHYDEQDPPKCPRHPDKTLRVVT